MWWKQADLFLSNCPEKEISFTVGQRCILHSANTSDTVNFNTLKSFLSKLNYRVSKLHVATVYVLWTITRKCMCYTPFFFKCYICTITAFYIIFKYRVDVEYMLCLVIVWINFVILRTILFPPFFSECFTLKLHISPDIWCVLKTRNLSFQGIPNIAR